MMQRPATAWPWPAMRAYRSVKWLVAAALLVESFMAKAAPACTPLPAYEEGVVVAELCQENLAAPLISLDLADDWAPRILSESPDHPQPYRAMFIAIANERFGQGPEWSSARRDAHFELYGIFPSFAVIRARFADGVRHACHERIDDAPLREANIETAAMSPLPRALERAAIATAQAHLECERLLPRGARKGVLDAATRQGLSVYQRRYMLASLPELDGETLQALLTPSRELDFRSLLRALRERVVDATGLIEDGSARNAWEPIFDRRIDSAEYRRAVRSEPLTGGAPDLVARATQAAAEALGWTSPEAARAALLAELPPRAVVALPALPSDHSAPMTLRVEIDRGDVWTASERRARPGGQRPILTLFVATPQGEVALVRWPTTVGGWKPEQLPGGEEILRRKASPTGRYYWRDLLVAPTWFPPPTTPDRELLQPSNGAGVAPDRDALGPGYRSAYGLLALIHDRSAVARNGGAELLDIGIRTHGSGNYRSVLRGSSHGCHRLFNHLAIRLGGFLLSHVENVRHGSVKESYFRVLHWAGRRFELRASDRGYRFELSPPIPVDVLPTSPVRMPAVELTSSRVAPELGRVASSSESASDPMEDDDGC